VHETSKGTDIRKKKRAAFAIRRFALLCHPTNGENIQTKKKKTYTKLSDIFSSDRKKKENFFIIINDYMLMLLE